MKPSVTAITGYPGAIPGASPRPKYQKLSDFEPLEPRLDPNFCRDNSSYDKSRG